MKVFFGGSFVLFVCYTLEFTASTLVNVSDASPKTTGESGEGAEAQTVTINVDDLPKELERRLAALRVNFKQLVGQLKAEWNRDSMLQAVLATDKSLARLRQLNQDLQVLPVTIRSKVEKLEQSVENIKTTVYHLIQSRDVEHHSFIGKIGNNSISLDSLSEWVSNLSSQVIEFEQTLSSSSEILAKVSEDLRFELKQLLIFVDRIGKESIPLELQTQVRQLEMRVAVVIDKISTAIKIRNQIDAEIKLLRTNFDTFEKSGEFANDLSLFREFKKNVYRIITVVEKPDMPTSLIKDAEDVKNIILLAEKHHVAVILWKLEKILEDIGTKLSFTNNTTDLIHIKENLEYVLTQTHMVQSQNISMEVQIRVYLIKQVAIKYEKLLESKVNYYENPHDVGVDVSLNETPQRTFEEKIDHLQHQYEQLKNLFEFRQSLEVLITIKHQIEKIIIHLNYLRSSGITPLQRQLTESVLKEIKYFYQLVVNKTQTTQTEVESDYLLPILNIEHNTTNNTRQPNDPISVKVIIEHLNTSLVNVDVLLSFPLHLLRIQEISVTLFEIINELRVLEERRLSADQQREANRIKQRAVEILILIQFTTQGETNTTKTFVISGNENSTKHNFDFEAYIKELYKQISDIPNVLRIWHIHEIHFNNTNPDSEEADTIPPTETFPDNNGCVGIPTYNRDLLLISARVESLQKHFSELMDGHQPANASYYAERHVQALEMLKELKTLHAFSALPLELKLKIEDLQQDLESFEKHVKLMLRIEVDSAITPERTTQPSSFTPDNKDFGNPTFIKTISSKLEAIRIRLPKEKSLSHIYQMNMQVHIMLFRVKFMRWNVPDGQRDQFFKLEEEITSLISDIELKIQTVRNSQSSGWQLPFGYTPGSQILFSDHRSISQLFSQIETLMHRLRRLTLRPERSFDHGSRLLLENGQNIQDQWARVTLNPAQPFAQTEQKLSVENRINYLHRALNRLNTELHQGHVNKTKISEELNRLLLDLNNLKSLRLPRRFQHHIDYLTAIGNYLKMSLEHASAGNVRVVETNTTQTSHLQRAYHEGYLILEDLTENLKNIQQKYFSAEDPLRLVHVLGDVYAISDQLRELQNESTWSELSQDAGVQQQVARVFLKTVKERVWTKILSPIKSEVGDLLAHVDPNQTSLSGERNETLAVQKDVSTLISDMNGLKVKIGAVEIQNRITAIVNHLLEISKRYTPGAFPKTEARLTKIVQSYL